MLVDGFSIGPVDGRKIRVLSIVDNFTRVSPALDVRTSYRGFDVVETLERIAAAHGRPKRIRLDNGPEFISKDLDLWAYQHDVVLDFSRPGKPTDNAFAEAFNGRVRAECPNAYWFLSLDDARVKCEAWERLGSRQPEHDVERAAILTRISDPELVRAAFDASMSRADLREYCDRDWLSTNCATNPASTGRR